MTPPTAVLTDRKTFLHALQGSGLLSAAQFAKASTSLPHEASEAMAAAQHFVVTGVLTQFQADRLLAGRTDGFVLGQYTILEQVGRGAMGRVFKAKHRTMNRFVGIKVLSADVTRTSTARESFQREVRAAAKLNHPNIVTAYDANEVGERFYLVLEFVDGPNLDTLVCERGPLPIGEACEIVRQVACGLQHAHEQGMVHRDVKPANLLAARPSRSVPGCLVKIADFGIARIAPVASTSAAVGRTGLLGTPDYVAPEQARDPHTADHRADLYSLGCVFYFLLAGRPPFPGGRTADKVHRHQHEQPLPIERVRPDVPPPVAELLNRLLAKDPNDRFQSAAALASRLDSFSAQAITPPGDTSGLVSFNLPAAQPGAHSFAQGFLTGLHPTAAAETSPWAQLTEDPTQIATRPYDVCVAPQPLGVIDAEARQRRTVMVLAGVCTLLALTVLASAMWVLRVGQ